ncbi:hypothetical protein QEN19_000845 [Hanseniaspora menglaensis]
MSDLPLIEIASDAENFIFAVAMHPSRNEMLIGFATGHVCCLKYTIDKSKYKNNVKLIFEKTGKNFEYSVMHGDDLIDEEQNSFFEILWKTKRHDKACRQILYLDEDAAVSMGSENILKKFKCSSGKVIDKLEFPELNEKKISVNCMYNFNDYILLGMDDKGIVKVVKMDKEDDNKLVCVNTLEGLHNGDCVNKIISLNKSNYQRVIKKSGKNKIKDEFIREPLSVHKFVSVGQTTMQVWDCRWTNLDKLEISEDQEDELLSLCYLNDDENDTNLICGFGEGILTVWKFGKNEYKDQINRIKISKSESVESCVSSLQNDNRLWCGLTNGYVYLVDGKVGKIIKKLHHSKTDEVNFLDIDYEYRAVSTSMTVIKIWDGYGEDEDENCIESTDENMSDSDDDSSDDANLSDELLSGEEEEEESNSDDEYLAEFAEEMKTKKSNFEIMEIKPSQKDIKKVTKKQEKKIQQELRKKEASLKHGVRKFEGL